MMMMLEIADDASSSPQDIMPPQIGIFEKFLSIWVMLSIALGVSIGHFLPVVPETLAKATIAEISIPIAVLVWGMILPMILQIDLGSVKDAWTHWKGIILTTSINYFIQPFAMYGFAVLFFQYAYSSVLSSEETDQVLEAPSLTAVYRRRCDIRRIALYSDGVCLVILDAGMYSCLI